MVAKHGPATLAARAFGGAAVGAIVATSAAVWKKVLVPKLHFKSTAWNKAVVELCPYFSQPYTLPALLNNGHVETIFAAWFRKSPHILYDREILHMPDGGVVALDTEDLPPQKVTIYNYLYISITTL